MPGPTVNENTQNAPADDAGANRCVCPVCGGQTIEIRGKAQCSRCHTICETCCEGARQ